jgi:hypothetical protein
LNQWFAELDELYPLLELVVVLVVVVVPELKVIRQIIRP